MENLVNMLFENKTTLSSFLKNNEVYDELLKSYYDRLAVVSQFSNEVLFIDEEIKRIQSLYLKPSLVLKTSSRIYNEMNFTAYVGYAYNWLVMGQDWTIEQVIKSARSGLDANSINEEDFSKSIVYHLKKGVAYLLYERFLKERQNVVGKNTPEITSDRFENISTEKNKLSMDKANENIFVSYAWDSPEHQTRVLSFTDFLRRKGFSAEVDKMLSQEESAIDFMKMMHQKMSSSSKVIIVLSKGYKEKAEKFSGGVGEEYSLIIKDIKEQPTKYILVSFEGISSNIVPLGLSGREIVNIQKSGDEDALFAKLMGHKTYDFSKVSEQKLVLQKKQIPEFNLNGDSSEPISTSQRFEYLITAIEYQQPNRIIKLRQELKVLLSHLVSKAPTTFSEKGTVDMLTEGLGNIINHLSDFAKLTYTIAIVDDNESALEIHKWFGNIIERYDFPVGYQGLAHDYDFDYYKFLGHELYTILVAKLLKEERWQTIHKLFSEWIHVDFRRNGPKNLTFKDVSVFVGSLYYEGEKRRRVSLVADTIKEHFMNDSLSEFCSFNEFMEADFFMFLVVEISPETAERGFLWRPESIIYMKDAPGILVKAQKVSYASNLSGACSIKNIDVFKQRMIARCPKINNFFNDHLFFCPVTNNIINKIGTILG